MVLFSSSISLGFTWLPGLLLHDRGTVRCALAMRPKWLTRTQAEALIEALPLHYALPAQFSLATGLRQSNVLQLRWNEVDKDRQCAWVHANQAKAGEPFRKIESRLWKLALDEAGITDFRWHDLRHTWAS